MLHTECILYCKSTLKLCIFHPLVFNILKTKSSLLLKGKIQFVIKVLFLTDKIVAMLEGFQSRSKAQSIALVCQVYPVFLRSQ